MDVLTKIYYDPKTGFIGARKLYEKVKSRGITYRQVVKFLKNQEVSQITNPIVKKSSFPIYGKIGSFQADLIFYNKYKVQNRGYNILLTAVDINTREGYAIALKSKKGRDIIEGFDQIDDIKFLTTDNGTEFLNKQVTKYFKDRGIEHNTNDAGEHNKMGKIESFNRTIKGIIGKYFEQFDTVIWFDVIDKIIDNYNNSYHSSIKKAPNEMTELDEKDEINRQRIKTAIELEKKDIDIGDKVRILRNKKTFEKEGVKWSKKIYSVIDDKGLSFKLDGFKGRYKPYQLLKVEDVVKGVVRGGNKKKAETTARVKRILRKEGIELEEIEGKRLIGRNIIKSFGKHGKFKGVVKSFKEPYYLIVYVDGDREEMTKDEVLKHLI